MKLITVSALISALLLAGSAPTLALCPAAWVNAYYTPNMLTPGVCPFTPDTVPSGCIAGVAYTASMCPGHYPTMRNLLPTHAWAPAVNEWLAQIGGHSPISSGSSPVGASNPGAAVIASASAGGDSSIASAAADDSSSSDGGWFPGSDVIAALQSTPNLATASIASAASAGASTADPSLVSAASSISGVTDGGVQPADSQQSGLGVGTRRRQSQSLGLDGSLLGSGGPLAQPPNLAPASAPSDGGVVGASTTSPQTPPQPAQSMAQPAGVLQGAAITQSPILAQNSPVSSVSLFACLGCDRRFAAC